jgi:plastocyanin
MKHLFTLFLCAPLMASAQVVVDVEVGGSLLPGFDDPYYDPMMVTIHVGDQVHWHCIEGTHNVYGMQDVFPDNPEGFTSGDPDDAIWDYTKTFTIPGTYNYHCTQQNHAATQHGEITVLINESVEEITSIGQLLMFPMPADGWLNVQLEGRGIQRIDIIGLDGRLLLSEHLGSSMSARVDLGSLATGRYIMRLTDATGAGIVRPFLKN